MTSDLNLDVFVGKLEPLADAVASYRDKLVGRKFSQQAAETMCTQLHAVILNQTTAAITRKQSARRKTDESAP